MSTFHVSIIIADHHSIIRHGIAHLLTKLPGNKVVAKVTNGRELKKSIAELNPTLVILEIMLPFLNGVHAIKQLIAAHNNLAILVVSCSDDPLLIQRIMDAGAKGYVLKTGPPEDIAEGVKAVAQGSTYFCSETKPIMEKYAQETPDQRKLTFSEEEEYIMRANCKGFIAKEIAAQLHIKVARVQDLIKAIQKKIGVKNAAAMSTFAIAHGIYKGQL